MKTKMQTKSKDRIFSFGKNWSDFIERALDEEKLKTAQESLLRYLPEEGYRDKVFIDVGCGSGIFSLSALQLGVRYVASFDVDPYSVEATKAIQARFSSSFPSNSKWEVFEGDILDSRLTDQWRGKGDIVYSWGVLHHTGDMYRAIENAAELVAPNGYLILAIYNRASSSDYWVRVKRLYNSMPTLLKKGMVYMVFLYVLGRRILANGKRWVSGRKMEPLFSRERGMSIFYDVVDWLGGYPYEYASFEEIKRFMEKLGFKLRKSPTNLPSPAKRFLNRWSFQYTGNNEFVFQRNETD